MPTYAPNKMPAAVKKRFFELIRAGVRASVAAREVGVSVSCGSVWFVDAGRVHVIERPISSRYLSEDDRIEIADGLRRGESVVEIADRIGKSFQSVYREIARNRKADGSYDPWYAHNQAFLRRQRPKQRRFVLDDSLHTVVADKLARRWSPAQISRWLRRRYPRRGSVACLHPDDLRGGVSGSGRVRRLGESAYRPYLSASSWAGSISGRSAEAVHDNAFDPRAPPGCRVPSGGRALGG
jgi:hypothetical protein